MGVHKWLKVTRIKSRLLRMNKAVVSEESQNGCACKLEKDVWNEVSDDGGIKTIASIGIE